MDNVTPANKMVGLILNEEWEVEEKIAVGAATGIGTGGNFSVSYLVKNIKTNKNYFLKAFDFEKTMQEALKQGHDFMKIMSILTADYQFEDKLNEICIERKMRQVIKVMNKGQEVIDGRLVPYLIMELAESGDIRMYVERTQSISLAMKLGYLKDVTLGIRQLHSADIAHQDLKPSNVMVFVEAGAKVGDLGRASLQGYPNRFDDLKITGDQSYAPPEQLYGFIAKEWVDRRQRCDIYQLGSIVSFLFTGQTINSLMKEEVPIAIAPPRWGGEGNKYELALPYLEQAFSNALIKFDTIHPDWLRDGLKKIVFQCSHPNYELRGSIGTRGYKVIDLGLDRIVSEFDHLMQKLKVYGLKDAK
ncbi:protein kinase domain-containing protein [Yersinia massiliensis]|uniref:protein kinase domain-containing protein n=1 Tax=Yersinia massiliensis TaxID=419257 RepID=UPI001CFD7C4C|nr:protein kinase [Yersinia massiliensis]MCB5308828.1 protein kinase [Yersinia massiliensis]